MTAHPPGVATQRMTCLHCGHEWFDLAGVFGERYKDGCAQCGSLYWKVEALMREPA